MSELLKATELAIDEAMRCSDEKFQMAVLKSAPAVAGISRDTFVSMAVLAQASKEGSPVKVACIEAMTRLGMASKENGRYAIGFLAHLYQKPGIPGAAVIKGMEKIIRALPVLATNETDQLCQPMTSNLNDPDLIHGADRFRRAFREASLKRMKALASAQQCGLTPAKITLK